jgi:hypothetical protein
MFSRKRPPGSGGATARPWGKWCGRGACPSDGSFRTRRPVTAAAACHTHDARVRLGGLPLGQIPWPTGQAGCLVLPPVVVRSRRLRPDVARYALLAPPGGHGTPAGGAAVADVPCGRGQAATLSDCPGGSAPGGTAMPTVPPPARRPLGRRHARPSCLRQRPRGGGPSLRAAPAPPAGGSPGVRGLAGSLGSATPATSSRPRWSAARPRSAQGSVRSALADATAGASA